MKVKKKNILPALRDWRTTDEDELNRRRIRAKEEKFTIFNMYRRWRVFSNYKVASKSGLSYQVEIRDLKNRYFSCTCIDFRKNGLGTCKHTEAVLAHLQTSFTRIYKKALSSGPDLPTLVVDCKKDSLKIEGKLAGTSRSVRKLFNTDSELLPAITPEEAYERLQLHSPDHLRISQDILPWLEQRRIRDEKIELRRKYEQNVQCGKYPLYETLVPLYPYQRQGMLHLAFTERALLADEMGLGKTIQAIAACALLHRIGKARHALIVTPASLKTEWEEQIGKFTTMPLQIVYGSKRLRLNSYANAPFFTIVNYEQVRSDALDINATLKPEIVVLDEAQRIKNWNTVTAQAVKRLTSRYSFILTGTPVENRIDELYSIVEFIDPTIFGPLFRFNREFYILDEKGRPSEYKNLNKLHELIKPVMLRRRKADVETELPGRDDHNRFVRMTSAQRSLYEDHHERMARLVAITKRRPLSQQEQEKLMRELAMMRMVCDSVYILDQNDTSSPKIDELGPILDEVLSENDVKVVVFSEWVRMLELVKKLCERRKIGYAWHTGSVPQRKRRAEINLFKTDPSCRVFLSSESGGVGLNLQNASVVINCDLPWNPARLEQRIARVWRKHQKKAVSVINLVAENTIEHRMLYTLAAKQGLSDGVLDGIGDLSKISLKSGAQAFFKQLKLVLSAQPPFQDQGKAFAPAIPADRSAFFAKQLKEKLNGSIVSCEEHFPLDGSHSSLLVVVENNSPEHLEKIKSFYAELFGPDKTDPLAPVNLNVIDKSALEALSKLEEQGLIKKTVRFARVLPLNDSSMSLSDEQKEHIDSLLKKSNRKVLAAQALQSACLDEEARASALDALFLSGNALALKHGYPQMESVQQLYEQPWNSMLNHHKERIVSILDNQDCTIKEIDQVVRELLLTNS